MRAALAAPGTRAQTGAMAKAEAAGQTLVGRKPQLSTRSRPRASALGPDVAGGAGVSAFSFRPWHYVSLPPATGA